MSRFLRYLSPVLGERCPGFCGTCPRFWGAVSRFLRYLSPSSSERPFAPTYGQVVSQGSGPGAVSGPHAGKGSGGAEAPRKR